MYKQKILDKKLIGLFKQGTFGIEKEGHRFLNDGQLTRTPHPKVFGGRHYHPYIQTDFAESQLELVTPTVSSEQEVLRWLSAIHEVVLRNLPESEMILPTSMPPLLPELEAIQEAQMSSEDTAYREYLSTKYGKYKQLVSGIHYNFGFSDAFLKSLKEDTENLVDFRNKFYMRLARQFTRYQWLLVYLLGATPLVPDAYFGQQAALKNPVKSIRSSSYGYVNHPDVKVSFDTLETYVADLKKMVDSGRLISEKEFYASVRFRGGETAASLIEKGIGYLEFRIFDLNPLAPYGILAKDLRFIHLFILLMIWLEEKEAERALEIGTLYREQVALLHPLEPAPFQEEGQWLFEKFLKMAASLSLSQEDCALIKEKAEQLQAPEKTVAGQYWHHIQNTGGFLESALLLAKTYKKEGLEKPFGLSAFANMELSTQAFLSDAIQAGVKVEILDENDQFLKLTLGQHVEYVKNGNMTGKDTYISPLIMENKVVTKKVLASAGFAVPESIQCRSLEEGLAYFDLVRGKPIVIKPKSTNYGLGISIFQEGTQDLEDFKTALTLAFKEDKEVMIEDYIFGTEYRFFVIGNQTRAILLRVPANVVGDGVSSIRQLVDRKNDSILRGDGKTTPLKKIECGPLETLQLKEQGYTFDTILSEGQVAYLRANSNISTGGDSIDMTDQVHDSYKELSVAITHAMQAQICGVDLIIPDIKVPADSSQTSYGIIEANFNPMMMMHIFPAVGESRRLSREVLDFIFPELESLNVDAKG